MISVTANVDIDLSTLLIGAAQSVLGFIALIIITLSIVLCVLFWNAGDRTRMFAFILFFVAASTFGAVILKEKKNIEKDENMSIIEQQLIELKGENIRMSTEINKMLAIKEEDDIRAHNDKRQLGILSAENIRIKAENGDKYGAYSYHLDGGTGGVFVSHGWATGQKSIEEAISLARKRCGHKRCAVDFSVKNEECASTTIANTSKGTNGREASMEEVCRMVAQRGGGECIIKKTICGSDLDNWG